MARLFYRKAMNALAQKLVSALRTKGATITTVESCTGGLLAGAITSVSGSSEVFHQGLITYANEAKMRLAHVPEILIATHGAVSHDVAHAMSEGGLRSSGADFALSITGIAGPGGGSVDKPVGLVWFGLSYKQEGEIKTLTQSQYFGDMGRDQIRQSSVEFALNWALEHLNRL